MSKGQGLTDDAAVSALQGGCGAGEALSRSSRRKGGAGAAGGGRGGAAGQSGARTHPPTHS